MAESKRETVVVTGGSAGIGRATVREFARHACNVAILARGKDGLEAARRDVEDLGGKGLAIPTDVADWKAVEAAADQVENELGPIDIWVNNAFAGIFSRFMDVTPEEFERVTQVTYLGQVNGTRAALKRMLPRDHGSIVLVGSALAYRGIPLQSAYCGAKHAIQGFIDSVRCELLHDKTNVSITMVQMPGVNTPQFDWIRAKLPGQPRPVGKVYQPEVAARAIYAAAHDGRKEMLVGLPTVEAVWGNKVASSLLDEYLAATGFKSQQRPERVQPDRKDNLFVPDLDEADLVLPFAERFEDAVDAVPGDAEDRVHAPVDQGFDEDVAAGFRHLFSPVLTVFVNAYVSKWSAAGRGCSA